MANVGVIATYPLFHGFFPNGDPLIGGKLYTYQAGTSTPAAAYHDAAATMPHMNPIILDDRGEALVHVVEAMLWRLETPTGVQLWVVDNIGAGGGGGTIPPSTVGVNHGDVSIGLIAQGVRMSRLFYHTMQDNAGNLLFDVSGTMRIAGTGTNAVIYGDPALSVILPNPMTNHPSYGSFKCYLGPGTYDFYMAKGGYTFETLTGLAGGGSMANQDADAVAVSGGTILGLDGLAVSGAPQRVNANLTGIYVSNYNPPAGDAIAFWSDVAPGTGRWGLFINGTANNQIMGKTGLGAPPDSNVQTTITFDKSTTYGLKLRQTGNDAGSGAPLVFNNVADVGVGSISTSATTTSYNTTSDARLKHAVTALTGELDVVKALRPVRFLWNADDSPGVGFLAHEVAAHVAGVVSGEPDAVNEDGSVRAQMIDYSKLVPWLVGACQTLAAHVESLTARLQVLEDALGV